MSKVPPEYTKSIAQKLDLHSPEELQDYYNNIPNSYKEYVKTDRRLRRELKPGVVIPEWEIEEARRNGTLSALFKSRGVYDG